MNTTTVTKTALEALKKTELVSRCKVRPTTLPSFPTPPLPPHPPTLSPSLLLALSRAALPSAPLPAKGPRLTPLPPPVSGRPCRVAQVAGIKASSSMRKGDLIRAILKHSQATVSYVSFLSLSAPSTEPAQ